MINKIKGLIYLVCDGCSDNESFLEFDKAVEFARENNWTTKKNNKEEWENFCPDCQE